MERDELIIYDECNLDWVIKTDLRNATSYGMRAVRYIYKMRLCETESRT